MKENKFGAGASGLRDMSSTTVPKEPPPGKKRLVICQKWEESERGWGTRPDGYSLHLTEADRKQFVEDYWSGMPAGTPDEYSRPDGTPYECEVDEEAYQKVETSKNGVRFNGSPPGFGGVDGWVPVGRDR